MRHVRYRFRVTDCIASLPALPWPSGWRQHERPSMSGPSMNGPGMQGGGMKGGGMQMNSMGGMGIFSRENMAMMIVDREKATKGMTADQAAAARQEEMAKDRAETPEQRQARKARYDSEWLQADGGRKDRRPGQAGRPDEAARHDGRAARQTNRTLKIRPR